MAACITIEFTQPPFGFEDCKTYTLRADPALGPAFAWLESSERPDTCFVLMDASCFAPDYRPELPPKALKALGGDGFLVWLICSVQASLEDATVNLRSPIVVDYRTRRGMQVVLDGAYPMQYPLLKGAV